MLRLMVVFWCVQRILLHNKPVVKLSNMQHSGECHPKLWGSLPTYPGPYVQKALPG